MRPLRRFIRWLVRVTLRFRRGYTRRRFGGLTITMHDKTWRALGYE